jgi:peptide/nickel transport system substrate-binding protein
MFESGDADWIYVPSTYRPQLTAYHGSECDAAGNCTEVNAEGYINAWTSLPSPAITPAQFNWNINIEGGNPYVGSGALDGSGIPADFFGDMHIRRAFNFCFDFDALVKDALNNDGVQAQGPIPLGMMGYREGEAPYYSFDLAKCEEEFKLADLDKDGVAAGDDEDDVWSSGFYMQIAYNEGNDTRRVLAEILKNGIETVNPDFSVQVLALPWPVLLNSRTAGKLPVYIGGWQEDYHDPHNWVQPFLSPQGAYGRIVNMTEDYAAKYDELIKQGASLPTVEERRPVYEQIQLSAQEDGVNIWAYQVLGREHFQKWIQGFYYNSAYSQASYTWIYALSKVAP